MSEAGDDLTLDGAHADVAGWVLGVLDLDDAERFAAHLSTCTACQQAVRDFQPMRGLLADADPELALPATLRTRTLRAVDQAAAGEARGRRNVRWLAAAAAVLVMAGAGLGFAWRAARPAAPSLPSVSVALTAPGGGSASGQAQGHLTPAGWSVRLSVRGLAPVPAGRGHYECWYVAPDDSPSHPDKVSAGSFSVGADGAAKDLTMWTVFGPKSKPGLRMIVTREPDNNPELTGPTVLSGAVLT